MFDLVREGALKIHISNVFALSDAAHAHRAIEAGQTTGSVLLVP
ncbi:zinc-binding dehydrogenase [Paraburkholderia sp. LEh10]|nr:zinc-binding dehydrogenase [Paraburkholderia sp. LEh10]